MQQAADQISDIINAFISGKISIFKIDLLTFILYFFIMFSIAEGLTVLVYKMKKRQLKKSHLVIPVITSIIVTLYMLSQG